MRDKLIDYLELYYKDSVIYEPLMDDILYKNNAMSNLEDKDGLYSTMTEEDLKNACKEFYENFGDKLFNSKELLDIILKGDLK